LGRQIKEWKSEEAKMLSRVYKEKEKGREEINPLPFFAFCKALYFFNFIFNFLLLLPWLRD